MDEAKHESTFYAGPKRSRLAHSKLFLLPFLQLSFSFVRFLLLIYPLSIHILGNNEEGLFHNTKFSIRGPTKLPSEWLGILIQLCGGEIVKFKDCDVCIALQTRKDPNEKKPIVKDEWVIESILQYKKQDFEKYAADEMEEITSTSPDKKKKSTSPKKGEKKENKKDGSKTKEKEKKEKEKEKEEKDEKEAKQTEKDAKKDTKNASKKTPAVNKKKETPKKANNSKAAKKKKEEEAEEEEQGEGMLEDE